MTAPQATTASTLDVGAPTELLVTRNVVVADDDAGMRATLARVVKQCGYQPHVACDGAEALELIARLERISLVILDVGMPKLNGLAALAALRRAARRPIPAIFVSGLSEDTQILDGYRGGADYYITKPFQPATLRNIIRYLVEDLDANERTEVELAL